MSTSNQDSKDLFELFKQEASTNLQYLIDNLLLFEQNPSDKSKIESIMRAAHSLKGAARIIGFNTFSHLAHLLEDCFVAVQKNNLILKPENFDTLLHAVDYLGTLSQLSDDEIPSLSPDEHEKMELIKNSILNITAQFQNESKPHQTLPIKEEEKTESALFSVLKNEILAQAPLIKKELETLSKKPSNIQDFSNLLTFVLSIKGTSNIANEKHAEAIAQSIENIINDLQSKTVQLTDEIIEKILHLLNELVQLTSQNQPLQDPSTKPLSETTSENTKVDNEKKIETIIKPIEQKSPQNADQFVRISATNLNKLMGLAAESLVETRRLEPLKQGLLQLKSLHRQLANLLNFAQTTPNALKLNLIDQQATQNLNQYSIIIQNQLEIFDTFSKNNSLLSSKLYNEVLASRMRPFSEGVLAFPRLVRNLARSLDKKISLQITGNDTPVDRDILEKLEAPLNHIIRNACDHGIEKPQQRLAAGKDEKGLITIDAHHSGGMLMVTISDDGYGINKSSVRNKIISKGLLTKDIVSTLNDDELFDFLFLPGFSTAEDVTEISGRGVGLDVVRNFVQEIGGKIRVHSTKDNGTTFTIQLPITRSVLRALSVEIDHEPYAIPLSRIDRILRIQYSDINTVEDMEYFHLDGNNIALFSLRQVLGFIPNPHPIDEFISVIVLREKDNLYSLVIDRILTETELVVRPLDPKLGKIACISATSITDDGIPVLILDVEDILKYIEKLLTGRVDMESFSKKEHTHKPGKSVLVIDDSMTVRETERRLLQNAGYYVETAVDGVDGWNSLKNKKFNLVITDIDMPRMDGFELVKHIKKDAHLKNTPVIIVSYKDRKIDHLKGTEVGADFYLTKSSFKDQTFISTVKSLIGEPTE